MLISKARSVRVISVKRRHVDAISHDHAFCFWKATGHVIVESRDGIQYHEIREAGEKALRRVLSCAQPIVAARVHVARANAPNYFCSRGDWPQKYGQNVCGTEVRVQNVRFDSEQQSPKAKQER